MKPYWTSADGNLTIYHGDARYVLPDLDLSAVDLVLTDPPYGIDGGRGTVNRRRRKGTYRGTGWSDTLEYRNEIILPIMTACRQRVNRMIVTPGMDAMFDYPRPDVVGDFFCNVAGGFTKWGYACTNPIFYYGDDPRAGKGQWPTGQLYGRTPQPDCDWHPCPKPLDAWQWLLCKGSLEGETVLDPFAGAFTTLLAAQRTGRKAIGIEIEEYYCERGAERLSQTAFDLPPTEPAPAQRELQWA